VRQVEYAIEAIKLGSTAVGIQTTEGIVLAVEKRITSPLLVRTAPPRTSLACPSTTIALLPLPASRDGVARAGAGSGPVRAFSYRALCSPPPPPPYSAFTPANLPPREHSPPLTTPLTRVGAQVPESIEKIVEVDEHIGCAMSGLTADARTLVNHGRVETQVRGEGWLTLPTLVHTRPQLRLSEPYISEGDDDGASTFTSAGRRTYPHCVGHGEGNTGTLRVRMCLAGISLPF
jgi:hypothetical protein